MLQVALDECLFGLSSANGGTRIEEVPDLDPGRILDRDETKESALF